jgi:hypothetical protein
MILLKNLVFCCALITMAACAHKTAVPETLEKYSAGDEIYEGLENNFTFKATLHNRAVSEYLIDQAAKFYDWSEMKVQSERQTREDARLQETEVFLSFFVPNAKDASLTDKNKVWRVYLTVGRETYDATVVKDKRKLTEVRAFYPYHNQWSLPYLLKFPIPTSQVEVQDSELTITGPLGKKTVKFSSL